MCLIIHCGSNNPSKGKKMASSQVEIASSSPFGCVLKEHNRRDRNSRETNARAAASATHAAFQKNRKESVRDNLQACISVSSCSSSDKHSQNQFINSSNNIYNNGNHRHRQRLRCLTKNQDDNNKKVDESSTVSCKPARNQYRWAAKQAQETVSIIERQSQDAEFLISSQKSSSEKVSYNSQRSVAQPENLSGSSKIGASSLVQIWEARLSRPEPKMDRSNSLKNNQNSAAGASPTSSGSSYNEIPSSVAEEPPRQSDVINSDANEEPVADCDSNAQSSHSSVNFKSSDAGENERVRVADIIKRLTSESADHKQGNSVGDPPSRRHSYGSDQAEVKALSRVTSLPKIKGRQALNDLLFQMEKERQRELVSLAERQSVSRFSQRGRVQSMLRIRCLQRGMAIQDQQRSRSIPSTIASDENRSQRRSTIMNLRERFSAGVEQATSSSSYAATTRRNAEESKNNIDDNRELPTLNHVIEDCHHQGISTPKQQTASSAGNSSSHTSEIHEEDTHEESSSSSDVIWQGTSPEARPRSYWEDRRQAWYQEMLTTASENNEIRQLLERRAVLKCLSSDFRQRMDRLMVSHVQRQDEESSEEEVDHDTDEGGREGEEEAEEEEYVEGQILQEMDEEESTPSVNSPSPCSSWNYSHHHEVDDSEQVPTAPSQQLFPTQGGELFSSLSNTSMEMDLIHNLREHIEQLQLEMSELRRSMQTCMEVQAEFIKNLKKDAYPVQEVEMNTSNTATKRRKCCICYEMEVDSFLYRCGHMCTCLKCAHELKWNSGKCPICRAPVLDVVKAYMDS
ncbi:hypothetical protein MANES_16G058900v8 [Manihot esculenta]|uniref:Uncharacterized protein n=1 Tax=Manihot esculenta TaxID=3983 RepID=A0ACB7G860_MANES|nr:hypothetical protein MANES_16G058900v8 [Manihot esculenta]